MNMASTKLCRLCAAEHIVIGHNFIHQHRRKKILNLKNKFRGSALVRQGSYGLCNPSRKGGSDKGESPKTELVSCGTEGLTEPETCGCGVMGPPHGGTSSEGQLRGFQVNFSGWFPWQKASNITCI
jgi:hypothetical protein